MSGARIISSEGVRYSARVAWRAPNGLGLCYFVHLDGELPSADDRADRRSAIEAGLDIDDVDEARLRRLLSAGAGLTDTERRLEDADGTTWLAQNVGPVWATGAAAGLSGVLFTRLTGGFERLGVEAGHIGALRIGALRRLLEEARALAADPDSGSDEQLPAD